jgi:hypothetical protein
MNKNVHTLLAVASGVALAGLIMHFGKDLPVISQAREGFGG